MVPGGPTRCVVGLLPRPSKGRPNWFHTGHCDPYGIPPSLFEQRFKGLLKSDIDGHEEFLKAQNQWLGPMTR